MSPMSSRRQPLTFGGGNRATGILQKEKRRPPRTTPKKWQQTKNFDTRSHGSGDSSAATPTSVVLGTPSVLTRDDLSDLSGSYINGNTVSRNRSNAAASYQSDQSATSYQRPWRLGKILSTREPSHPQPQHDSNDSVVRLFKERLLEAPEGLEIVPHCGDSTSMDTGRDTGDSSANPHERQPVIILLMDPGQKLYELMQLWIDPSSDSVRDVLHAVQLGLSNRWRQDYDGLFQTRNNTFSQLIHILDVAKYDVRPYEIWVAKPWAMPAKATINYATRALQHLEHLQIVSHVDTNNPSVRVTPSKKPDETLLVLSHEARSRTYVPGGMTKNHHSRQFLSFSPPFEPTTRVDVLATSDSEGDAASQQSASQLSDSQLGTSFGGSNGEGSDDPFAFVPVAPHDTSGLNTGHEVVRMRLSKYPTPSKSSSRTKSSLLSTPTTYGSRTPSPGKPTTSILKTPSKEDKTKMGKKSSVRRKKASKSIGGEPRGIARLFAAMNCGKSRKGKGLTANDENHANAHSLPASPLDTMETMRESSVGGDHWKVWEDEASLKSQGACSQSMYSVSRPLIGERPKSTNLADWH